MAVRPEEVIKPNSSDLRQTPCPGCAWCEKRRLHALADCMGCNTTSRWDEGLVAGHRRKSPASGEIPAGLCESETCQVMQE